MRAGQAVESVMAAAPAMMESAALGAGLAEILPGVGAGARLGSALGPYGAVAGGVAGAVVGAAGAEAVLHSAGSWVGTQGSRAMEELSHLFHAGDRNAPAPLRDFTTNNVHPSPVVGAAASASGYSDYNTLREQAGPGDYGSGLGRSAHRGNTRRP